MEDIQINESNAAVLLTQSESAVDNLTEYNTTYNRQISGIEEATEEITEVQLPPKRHSRKRRNVVFHDEGIILNSEDVDQIVGRIIPMKRFKIDDGTQKSLSTTDISNDTTILNTPEMGISLKTSSMISEDLHKKITEHENNIRVSSTTSMDVDIIMHSSPFIGASSSSKDAVVSSSGLNNSSSAETLNTLEKAKSPKKIYAKETWPGRRPKSYKN